MMMNKQFLLAGMVLALGLAACSSASPAATQPSTGATLAPTTASTAVPAAAPETPASTAPVAASATAELAASPSVESTAEATPEATPEAIVPSIRKINLNTATADEILAVPNTGNRMVREFEEYRPYTTITQFRREIGKYVDEAQVAEYEKYVYVPVVPNDADAATLMQLPGVDQAIADQLIAARPFASKEAFLQKLAELTSAEQSAAATDYVQP